MRCRVGSKGEACGSRCTRLRGLVPALAPVDGIEQGRDERHPGTAGYAEENS